MLKKKTKHKGYLLIVSLVVLSLIPLFDLFKTGLPITHDGPDHVIRLANFYQNLSEGNIIPRWAANVNYGYGHPVLMFFYPLPYFAGSFFHFLGFTLIDSIKLVFGMSFVLSGLTMYFFIKELFKDERSAFFASLLYMIAPYRFVDLYVRGAIGEHIAFVFPPLVFFFLLKLSKRYSSWYVIGGAISIASLNLSHNAISIMFMPLFILYALFLFSQSKKKIQHGSQYLMTVLLGFGVSAFFWIPAFFEGKYTLRDIVTSGGEYGESFVMWKDFFIGGWSYGGTLILSKQIGIVHWIGIIGSIFVSYYLYRNKNRLWIVTWGSLIILAIVLFLMTAESNLVWQSFTLLQKFQFPWRFLSIAVFGSALLSAIALHPFSDKYKKILLLILGISLLIVNKDYWHAKDYLLKDDSFFTSAQRTTTNDTGESSPIWSTRFMEVAPRRSIEIIDGKGKIRILGRSGTKHAYQVTAQERIRIRENTLYFPGWTVLVDGKKENIEFQDQNNRGLITFYSDKGEHDVYVEFKETRLRLIADIISFFSLFFILTLGILKKTKLWRRFQ